MMLGAITLLTGEGLFLGVLGSPTPGDGGPLHATVSSGNCHPPMELIYSRLNGSFNQCSLYGNYGWSKDSDFAP